MKRSEARRGRPAVGARLLAFAFVACSLVVRDAHAQSRPGLSILLTNDDGYEAPGLTTLKDALVAAGHSVTVVAPLDDRSGAGAAHTISGLIDYYQQSEGVWAVDGTPADAVTLALVHVMREAPPDLVIVGTDFGQNAGATVVHSGTVGAAVTASRIGFPAIAVSVALDFTEAGATPSHASTRAALAPAADFVVGLVRQLHETDAQGLLPPRVALNVNYPALGTRAVAGVRFAPVASVRAFRQVFAVAGSSGPARVETVEGDATRAQADSDLALLGEGFVTISVLDGSFDAGPAAWEPLLSRLAIER